MLFFYTFSSSLLIINIIKVGYKLKNKVKDYFNAWITNDISCIERLFSDEIYYNECYGPEYYGVAELTIWFKNWHHHGKVLEWTIKNMWEHENHITVEWYFKCEYDQNINEFDGVSLIAFNEAEKIISLKEFESKVQHYRPYH